MQLQAARQAVVEQATELAALTPGRTGNLSVRDGDAFAITPTAVPYDSFGVADVPVVGIDGEQRDGKMAPSSEVPMHASIYDRYDTGAIVHTHGEWSTTLAVAHEELPPIHYMILAVGKRVPVAEYARYGTDDLAANIVEAMEEADSSAALIENHGLVVTADDVETAVENAHHVESIAKNYLEAKAAGLEPQELTNAALERALEAFGSYQQPGVEGGH